MLTKIKAFFAATGNDFADTWKRLKVLIFVIAGLLVYLKFDEIKNAISAYNGKKEIDTTKKQDGQDTAQENIDKKQADALVADANALPSEEKPVTDVDWYKKGNS